MEVFIKTTNESKTSVQIDDDSTVLQLKESIETSLNIPFSQQRLIFSGKVLKDGDVLSSVGIKEGVTIHLVKSAPKTAHVSSNTDGNTSSANNSPLSGTSNAMPNLTNPPNN